MAEKIYNKLVRDKIPQIIKQSNQDPFIYTATAEEIKPMLYQKLIEELEEFKATPNEEELADMLEVLEGIAHAFHFDMDKVLEIKEHKKEERGGFKEGIVLEKVKS